MQRQPPDRKHFRGIVALIGALACVLALHAVGAVPPGYRYIGSRSVSAGRVVLWYWNADIVEPGAGTGSVAFTAHLYARAPDVGQERPYLAIVRCDNRTYRPAVEAGPFQPIDDGEPIAAVWRAGCADGVVVDPAQRRARLDGTTAMAATAPPQTAPPPTGMRSGARATASPVPESAAASASAGGHAGTADASAPAAQSAASAPATPSSANAAPPVSREATDPRRVDACVRLSDVKGSPAGDASITNTCRHPIEVSLCYKGDGGGPYDCAATARGRLSDSLGPGVTHVLPEYRRTHHRGIAAVACRGAAGTVLPRLQEPGHSSCF